MQNFLKLLFPVLVHLTVVGLTFRLLFHLNNCKTTELISAKFVRKHI